MDSPLADRTLPSDTMSDDRLPELSPHHRMPDVIMIGAAKSATTLLTRWIAQHPAIGLCGEREPNFFSHPQQFDRGLDWYSCLFAAVRDDQLAFDSSTGYTQWPQFPRAAARIAHYAPRAKLLYLMRHPVERAYSHYVHRWTKECHVGEPFRMTFDEYVREDPLCVDGSNYQAQIEQYLEYFPAESLLCLFTFQLREAPLEMLRQICRFLEIDDDPGPFEQRPEYDNRAEDFLEGMVRVQVTDRVKRLPAVKQLLPLIPAALREGLYQRLRRSQFGRSTAQRFEAPPLSDTSRRRWIERFAESTAWVAKFSDQDLSCWNE
jgi:hypothetical protein